MRVTASLHSLFGAIIAFAIVGSVQPCSADTPAPPPRRFEPIPSPSPMQRDTPVQVLVSKVISGPGRVTYNYRVVNGNPYPIARVTLGYDDFYGVNELLYEPLGWDPDDAPTNGSHSPPGWAFHLVPTEEDSLFAIEWETESGSSALLGGTSLDGFSVTLGGEDAAYERSHWSITTTGDDDYMPHTWFILPDGKTELQPSSIQAQTGVRVRLGAVGDSVGIGFDTTDGARVTVRVYDASGKSVRIVNSAYIPPGRHELVWDGRDDAGAEVPNGEYFIRIWAPQGLRQARIVIERSRGGQSR